MRCVLYGRYSTDKQSEESIVDQFRVCERIAASDKFTVVGRYSDKAISGGTAKRPGYQAMLAAAERREFEVIVAEDTSRLWRELAEQWRAVKTLADLGVHIVCNGLDTRRSEAKLLLSVNGAMAEAYRDEIARRTRRGLEGRALAKKSTGGRAYGYFSAHDSASGNIAIDPVQAPVVVRIFEEFAAGRSPREIAGGLNSDGIPSPGASWNRKGSGRGKRADGKWQASAIHGQPARGTGILNNEKYVGQFSWGRTKWKRGAADSSVRTPMLRDRPLQTHTDDSLRIVPQGLWNKVKARQADISLSHFRVRDAVRGKAGRPARHLLSGLFACGDCGGSMVRVNAREYGCASFKSGGESACSNQVRIPFAVIESQVVEAIRAELLSPEAVEFVVAEVRRGLREARKHAPTAPASDQTVAVKDREIEELRNLIRRGVLSGTAGQAAMSKVEEERDALLASREAKRGRPQDRVLRLIPDIAQRFRLMLDRLPMTNLPPDELAQARAAIHAMLGGRATVERGEAGIVKLRLHINGRPLLGAAGTSVSNLVAGAGFEPATFGL